MNERVRHIIKKTLNGGKSSGPHGASYVPEYDDHLDPDLARPGSGISARAKAHNLAWKLGYFLRRWWVFVLGGFASMVSVYYFNYLETLRAAAEAAGSSVVVYMQMRKDLNVNLEKAVTLYVQHEKEMFSLVAELRSSMVGLTPELKKQLVEKELNAKPDMKKSSNDLLGRIFAIGEQYPDLKFSSEFHFLASTLFETEKKLAAARVRYNTAADMYLTALTTVPGNFFGPVFRFKPIPYFVPDKGGVDFRPMEFGLR